MSCSKCGGNQNAVSGVSKKNGKPWSGMKCVKCYNIDFNNTRQDPVTQILNKQIPEAKVDSKHIKNELLNECVLDNAVKLAIHTCKPEGALANVTMITEVQTYYENLLKIINNEPEI